MSLDEISRRTFIGIALASSAGVLVACSTSNASDQSAEKEKLRQLRSEDKYQEKTIEIGDNFFSPKFAKIQAGTIVIWKHVGRSLHDINWDEETSENKNSTLNFSSGNLGKGDIHVHLFDKPGEYFYHCRFHGGPKRGHYGSITVSSTDRTP